MKQRILLLLATLCILASLASAQISGPAYRIYSGPTLPSTCDPGSASDTGVTDVFIKTTATKGIYYCSATNTWTNAGGGGGGGIPGGADTNVQVNDAGSFNGYAGFVFDKISKIGLGVAGTSVGTIQLFNATSGSISVIPVTGALGTVTLSLPAATDTLVGKATTDTFTNKTISGASNTLSNIGNSSLTNSTITINAGTNFGITAPGSSSLGATVTIGATTDNLRFANLGLGVAASTSGGQITSTLGANNVTGLLIKRNTDTSPTGKFFDFQNAAGSSLASMDITGALTVASCTGCGGSSGITVGTTTITSGTSGRVLYNNAGVVGEMTTSGSGTQLALTASPTFTGTVNAANTVLTTAVTTGTGATAGLNVTANSLTTGNGVDISSSSATAGNLVKIASTSTAAASSTLTGLNIAMSGANGTTAQTVTGAAISVTNTNATSGTNVALTLTASGATTANTALNVAAGQALFSVGSASAPGVSFASNTNYGFFMTGGALGTTIAGTHVQQIYGGGEFRWSSGVTVGWTSSDPVSVAKDVILRRAGVANMAFGNTDAASPVAQILSVQGGTGTNTNGATWTHQASLGTSQGVPGRMSFTAGGLIAASGTTSQTAVSRLELGATKVLANNTATTLVNVTDASNTVAAGVLDYAVEVFDGTDVQTEVGSVSYMVTNKGGTIANNTTTKFGNQQAATAGTLSVTWTISAANPALLQINANSSLTPSTGYPRVTYAPRNLTQQAIAVQ